MPRRGRCSAGHVGCSLQRSQRERCEMVAPVSISFISICNSLVKREYEMNIFHSFFNQYPEYQQKFPGFAHVPLDQLAENRRLKAHAITVMNAINGLVDNLDDPEVLTELLIKTGQNHARRKLQLSDFTVSLSLNPLNGSYQNYMCTL